MLFVRLFDLRLFGFVRFLFLLVSAKGCGLVVPVLVLLFVAITSLGVRLFDSRLFGFVCFLFLLVSGRAYGLLLWHSLDFSLTAFCDCETPWTFLLPLFRIKGAVSLK